MSACKRCLGSGLEPCAENLDIPAAEWKRYIICTRCHGEGREANKRAKGDAPRVPGLPDMVRLFQALFTSTVIALTFYGFWYA